ncbi:MAG: septum formation protein Maf [Deferribacteres bacterium]|nr:septum formation protein Maf [Deferribacteres bacterium]
MVDVVLVSKSPRRRELLKQIVPVFEVVEPQCSESLNKSLSPEECVLELSSAKLDSVKDAFCKEVILVSADTVVEVDGEIMGKPKSLDEAKYMLSKLSGREHRVFTGVCVSRGDALFSGVCKTCVLFKRLSQAEIDYYVDSVNVLDKAGAYAIQDRGELFVEEIRGSYSNVVGLPLNLTYRLMREAGFPLVRWVRLMDVASVVRSKNAGPFELTFDVMFEDEVAYRRFKEGGFITKRKFSSLYGIDEKDILVFEYFDQAQALKITVKRNPPSGDIRDRDIYGAQMHVPLMNYLIPWEEYG